LPILVLSNILNCIILPFWLNGGQKEGIAISIMIHVGQNPPVSPPPPPGGLFATSTPLAFQVGTQQIKEDVQGRLLRYTVKALLLHAWLSSLLHRKQGFSLDSDVMVRRRLSGFDLSVWLQGPAGMSRIYVL
jgi:hypothetical protein